MPTFPDEIAVTDIDRHCGEHKNLYGYWERLRMLSEGGHTMWQNAAQYLLRRPMEPNDVFTDRLAQFEYTGHMETILGWYTSALFKDPPTVILRKREATGDDAIQEAEEQADQLAKFQNNCDGSGRTLIDFWSQEVETRLLLYKKAYILYDLPYIDQSQQISRKAQQDAGGLQPFLMAYSPQDIINYQTDDQGNLTWAIIKVRVIDQPDPLQTPVITDRWYYYDSTQVVAYEAQLKQDNDGNLVMQGNVTPYATNQRAKMLPTYPRRHALSDIGQIPIFLQQLHDTHWLGKRIASPLQRLINLENSYDWALQQTNLPLLLLFTEEEINTVVRGEAKYLKLAPNDKAEYLEQTGAAFSASQTRLSELREEIFRLGYLVQMGRSSSATAASQSGISKEQDMVPARDVLSALGDLVRATIQKLLQVVANQMELNVDVDVQGFDFSDRTELIDLELYERGTTVMPITSTTLEREVMKRIARLLIPDANREVFEVIDQEIKLAKTPGEQEQEQQQLTTAAQLGKIATLNSPKAFQDAADAH